MTADEPLGRPKLVRSAGQHIIHGSAWMIAWRWGVRLIGLVSTIFLARLLSPADFGIIAMAMIIVGFLEVLTDTNANLAIIKTKELTRAHVDTVWTIQVIVGVVGGLLTIACAPIALLFFNSNWQVVFVIVLLSGRAFANAFINVGVVSFQRNLDFAKDFRFGMYEKVFSFLLSLTLAFTLRSYWALALSIVAGRLFALALSYRMDPYRPRFNLSHAREIWNYSSWLSLMSISRFVASRIDEFVVGNQLGSASMGQYAVAMDVSTAPTVELLQPAWRAVFPVFATLSDEQQRLRELFLSTLSVVIAVAVPMCLGLSAIAPDFVNIVLGAKWQDAIPLVALLALSALPIILIEAVTTVLNVHSHSNISARLTLVYTFALGLFCIVGFTWFGMAGAAAARLIVLFSLLPLVFWEARVSVVVTAGDIFRSAWRPLVAAAAMTIVARSIEMTDAAWPLLRMMTAIAAGATTYVGVSAVLWQIAGRPNGVETWILNQAPLLLRRPSEG